MSNKNNLHGSEQLDKTWKPAVLLRELSALNFLVLRKSLYEVCEKKVSFPLISSSEKGEKLDQFCNQSTTTCNK